MSIKQATSNLVAEHSAQHATFTIEREFAAAPAAVFAAWATVEAKSRWFGAPPGSWKPLEREFEFRVGGRERLKGTWNNGTVSDFDARYQDIVPDQRIVYSYDMHLNDNRISVSLSTVEFQPFAKGTHVKYTEQAVYLDGYDDAGSRERGTRALLDNLAASLEQGAH
ncbi:MAG TPA: SRPBCC family protein [Gammaproteobacteria bacterium]